MPNGLLVSAQFESQVRMPASALRDDPDWSRWLEGLDLRDEQQRLGGGDQGGDLH
jgi:hypothetical protein